MNLLLKYEKMLKAAYELTIAAALTTLFFYTPATYKVQSVQVGHLWLMRTSKAGD
jgi:hypothetical protein